MRYSRIIIMVFIVAIISLLLTACAPTVNGMPTDEASVSVSDVDTAAKGKNKEIKIDEAYGDDFYDSPSDPMAAFDNDPNTYVAGKDATDNWQFEAIFAERSQISDIEIMFYSNSDYCSSFVIEGYTGQQWEKISSETNLALDAYTKYYYVRNASEKEYEKIRVTVTQTKGQARPLIREIKFNVVEPNTLRYANAKELAQELGIFSERMSEHQKCMYIMDWISREVAVGTGTADTYLDFNKKVGACGDVSSMMVALANAAGMEAYRVGIYNSPYIGYSHVTVNVKWGGEWHMYDPAFGAFYLTDPNEMGNLIDPPVASAEQIVQKPELAKNKIAINIRTIIHSCYPNLGDYQWVVDGELDSDGVYTSKEGYNTSAGFYTAAEPMGAIGPEYPMVFPAYFSLKEGSAAYGEENQSHVDLVNPGQMYAGIHLIGSAFISPIHEYRMTELEPGHEYLLRVGIIEGSEFSMQISGTDVQILGEHEATVNAGDTLEVRFRADKSEGALKLSHNYTNGKYILLDYISIEKVE